MNQQRLQQMALLCQTISSLIAAAAFAITLYACVAGGQDLLMSALKSIGAYLLVRFIAQTLASMILAAAASAGEAEQ